MSTGLLPQEYIVSQSVAVLVTSSQADLRRSIMINENLSQVEMMKTPSSKQRSKMFVKFQPLTAGALKSLYFNGKTKYLVTADQDLLEIPFPEF